MNNLTDIQKDLNPQYFWDVDIAKLDLNTSKRLIIERVFSLGNLQEMKILVAYYGRKEIIDVLCALNYLDPKTLNFISKFFNVPKNNFRCYTKRRSVPRHWNS